MAIGLITSPASWLNGTIVAPAWMQQVQDNVNFGYGALAGGTKSIFSIDVDGVGNQSVTGTPGTINALILASQTVRPSTVANGANASLPNPAITKQALCKDMIAIAGGRMILHGGTTYDGDGGTFGIASVSRVSAGVINITIANALSNSGVWWALVTGSDSGINSVCTAAMSSATVLGIKIVTCNTGAVVDSSFSFMLWGT